MSRPSFDGNDLNTFSGSTGIMVQGIKGHESLPNKTVSQFILAHANQSAIPYVQYPNRIITITGQINGSSIADLDARVDAFKYFFLGTDKNLDIDYAGSVRRFIATANTVAVDRPGGLLYADFTVTFTCNYPFGQNTSTSNALNQSGRTLGTYTDAYSFLGTAPFQLPLWTLTLTNPVSSSTNMVTNPGLEVDTTGWSTGGVGTISRVTTQHNTGVAALQCVNAGAAVGGNYGWPIYFLSGTVLGQTYLMSVWLKGNAGGETVKVGVFNAAGGTTTYVTVTLTTSWQQVFLPFTATSTTSELDFISTGPASATWFIDDVNVTVNTSQTISIGNANNGQQMNITRTWQTADVLVVDTVNKAVTVNGAPVAYTGAFPEFPPGSQSLYYLDGFVSRTLSEVVTYYPMFL